VYNIGRKIESPKPKNGWGSLVSQAEKRPRLTGGR